MARTLPVENAKIALSDKSEVLLALEFIEADLSAAAARQGFDEAIAAKTDRLHATAAKCIKDAGLRSDAIQTIFFTGGSSRVPAVREAVMRAAPTARVSSGSDFLSVALGLTLEAHRRFG